MCSSDNSPGLFSINSANEPKFDYEKVAGIRQDKDKQGKQSLGLLRQITEQVDKKKEGLSQPHSSVPLTWLT